MRADDLDFELPLELIAQMPAARREASRLLHYRRAAQIPGLRCATPRGVAQRSPGIPGSIDHRQFSDLPRLLHPGDLLVFNDARVVPARFLLQKATGGRVEGLFLSETAPGEWWVLLRNAGGYSGALRFVGDEAIGVAILERLEGGEFRITVESAEPALVLLSRLGRMPLPPYIKREREADARDELDRERYQTVYARSPGAVAAPTAGLHFTDQLIGQLDEAGVGRTFVTLHVGIGTFRPVSVDRLDEHVMHSEAYEISAEAAAALNAAKAEGRRIVAVGTTAARVLESQPADRAFEQRIGDTSIFIYPPYEWRHVGAMITNFHLPRSTLIAMVAAMVGLEEQRRIYAEAIEQRYRFFSYGDAMLIE
jgi:S-adenosylmethionine:tRNA ribosyltransferase-isomerase